MPKKHSQCRANQWKSNTELLYDFLYEEKLDCPSYACTFGPLLSATKLRSKYRLFQSHATNANYLKDKHIWQGLPHALLVCDAYFADSEVEKVEITKRLIHPGPILRIKGSPLYPHLVATHTQHKYVFLWNTATQHDRKLINNSDPNTPELILKGHRKDAVHALDFNRNDLSVASGGKDQMVCCWNIGDYQTICSQRKEPENNEHFVPLSKPSPKLKPRVILQGHCGEVTDVEFAPNNPFSLCSVSDDQSLKIWDIRSPTAYSATADIQKLHGEGISNLSWNTFSDHLIVTAGYDGTIKLLDIRQISKSPSKSIVHSFRGHSGHRARVSSLQWNPSKRNCNLFMSASHDGTVVIWDSQSERAVFKHIGHLNQSKGDIFGVIHSASWLAKLDSSWSVCSTSSTKPFVPFFWSSSSEKCMDIDGGSNGKNMEHIQRGGLMQIWRPSVMLRKSKEDVLKHLLRWNKGKYVDDLHAKQ